VPKIAILDTLGTFNFRHSSNRTVALLVPSSAEPEAIPSRFGPSHCDRSPAHKSKNQKAPHQLNLYAGHESPARARPPAKDNWCGVESARGGWFSQFCVLKFDFCISFLSQDLSARRTADLFENYIAKNHKSRVIWFLRYAS